MNNPDLYCGDIAELGEIINETMNECCDAIANQYIQIGIMKHCDGSPQGITSLDESHSKKIIELALDVASEDHNHLLEVISRYIKNKTVQGIVMSRQS